MRGRLLDMTFFRIVCSCISFRRYGSVYTTVRVRFAPSPTGFIHLGGLRTALYNFLFARKMNGKFILRIEDTDQKRVVPGSAENLYLMLKWTGLIPDESPEAGGPFGPYIQSERLKIYQEKANYLLESGAAYRCFCSEERLNILRKEAMINRVNYGYDNKCRHLTQTEIENLLNERAAFTIRFKVPNKTVSHADIVFGPCTYNLSENEGDFIIMKSDGFPTYHFSCVVDDNLMQISHVLRGTEWLISTPKHIMLYDAFGWNHPVYAHLPLLMNSDRTKLSKRQESLGVEYFKKKGYSAEALLNFLASAGGGFGRQEACHVYDLDTLCSKFCIENINTNSCILDLRKLDLFNHNYLSSQLSNENSAAVLIEKLRCALREKYGSRYESEEKNLPDSYVKKILLCYKERMNNILDLIQGDMTYLWTTPDLDTITSKLSEIKSSNSIISALADVKHTLSLLSETEFIQDNLNTRLKDICKKLKIPYAQFMLMLRTILTSQKDGPPVAEILFMLGKQRSLDKISTVEEKIKDRLKQNVHQM